MHNEERFNEIISIVSLQCDDAPRDVVERALIDAMREVADTTEILTTTIKPTELQAGVAEYDFSYMLPEGYDVVKIKWVMLCKCKLKPVDKCDQCPHGYEVISTNCIKLHPCPTMIKAGDLEICLCLRPDYNVCELPNDLLKEERHLINGTIAMLAGQYKMPWGDRNIEQAKSRQFRSGNTRLSNRVRENFTEGKQTRMDHGFF